MNYEKQESEIMVLGLGFLIKIQKSCMYAINFRSVQSDSSILYYKFKIELIDLKLSKREKKTLQRVDCINLEY